MRSFAAGLIYLAALSAAAAADYGDTPLRGSQPYVPGYPTYFRWSGAYVGAQVGWSVAHGEMNRMTTLQLLGDSATDASYGALLGYNVQWENAVLGAEANYSHTNLHMFGDYPPGFVSTLGTVSARLTDYATFRGRAGWAFGNVMPYGFAGLAAARTDFTRTFGSSSVFHFGWALGLGVDWAFLPNVFLRAEYEYVGLSRVEDMNMHLSTVRGAVAVKF